MKSIKLSIVSLIALGTLGYAGGDFAPVTDYEVEDIQLAEEEAKVPVVVPEPVPVAEPVVPQPAKPNGFYAGLGITAVNFESNCNCPTSGAEGKDKNLAVLGRLGYDFNRYIGLEARAMKTFALENGADVEHYGLFAKPMYPVMDQANIYGLLGVAKTQSSGKLQNVDAETFALGAGFEYDLSKDDSKDLLYRRAFDGQGDQEQGVGLFVDYERLMAKDGAPALDTLSAGVTYDF
ncbi:MAG: porin family protein [Campylobacterales bacterium]|nr:porin family protein [Campylobacterales bacterium]